MRDLPVIGEPIGICDCSDKKFKITTLDKMSNFRPTFYTPAQKNRDEYQLLKLPDRTRKIRIYRKGTTYSFKGNIMEYFATFDARQAIVFYGYVLMPKWIPAKETRCVVQ
ncbi:hypothetical protein HYALB_00000254 [Hymenoscyphus albidus]|uniref:Uncharacterized protein n=1 Tax=Hymenoscyphus albidus TaxID=595503 RepID=A0A9N9LV26_9HELO|nr:hypothetical protein HYALB_00000254 [Hymenoscyphus albidus]